MKTAMYMTSALFMAFTMTACGSGEPASAPNVTDSDKSAVQEKLNKQDSKTNETKADDKQSDESTITTQAETEAQTVTARISLLRTSPVRTRITMSER